MCRGTVGRAMKVRRTARRIKKEWRRIKKRLVESRETREKEVSGEKSWWLQRGDRPVWTFGVKVGR